MKKNIFYATIFSLFLVITVFLPISAFAADGGINLPGGVTLAKPASLSNAFSDLNSTVNFFLNLLVGIAGTIFIVMLIVGGFQYMTSAGNEEAAEKAKKTLINAIIGIVIVSISWVAGSFILEKVHIGGGNSGNTSLTNPDNNSSDQASDQTSGQDQNTSSKAYDVEKVFVKFPQSTVPIEYEFDAKEGQWFAGVTSGMYRIDDTENMAKLYQQIGVPAIDRGGLYNVFSIGLAANPNLNGGLNYILGRFKDANKDTKPISGSSLQLKGATPIGVELIQQAENNYKIANGQIVVTTPASSPPTSGSGSSTPQLPTPGDISPF